MAAERNDKDKDKAAPPPSEGSTDNGAPPAPPSGEGTELSESKRKLKEQHEAKLRAKAAAAEAEQRRDKFVVAPGKSITTARGIVDSGQVVTALDFVRSSRDREHGEKRLAELLEKRVVVRA